MSLPASRIFVIVCVIVAVLFAAGWFLVYQYLKRLRKFLIECRRGSDEEDDRENIYQAPILLIPAIPVVKQEAIVPMAPAVKVEHPIPTASDPKSTVEQSN